MLISVLQRHVHNLQSRFIPMTSLCVLLFWFYNWKRPLETQKNLPWPLHLERHIRHIYMSLPISINFLPFTTRGEKNTCFTSFQFTQSTKLTLCHISITDRAFVWTLKAQTCDIISGRTLQENGGMWKGYSRKSDIVAYDEALLN